MKGSRGRPVDNALILKEILDAESLHLQRKRVRFEASFHFLHSFKNVKANAL